MKTGMKKGDFLIIIITVVLAAVCFVVFRVRQAGEYVYITANGKTAVYSLHDNRTIPLKKDVSDHNTVVIENEVAYMKDATCPDQICVRHKAISKNGEVIICLPNQVFVEIESSKEKEIDN